MSFALQEEQVDEQRGAVEEHEGPDVDAPSLLEQDLLCNRIPLVWSANDGAQSNSQRWALDAYLVVPAGDICC